MIFNVATYYDNKYLEEVSKFKEVKVLYGKLPSDFVGGGCETSLLNDISRDYLVSFIKDAKQKGISFNYVINAPSINNDEYSKEGRKQLDELLDFLQGLDLESVTVANPFMVMYIKKNFEKLRLKASANFNIDSVEKAKHVKSLGTDILVLDPLLVNRDFKALKEIRKAIGEEIEILLNNNCIMNCSFLNYHQNYLGANSRGIQNQNKIDFCYTNCSKLRITDPIYWIKGEWVRPEDISVYQEIGYNRFKITDRCAPQEILLKRIKAYANKKYEGNLLDLIQHYYYRDSVSPLEYQNNVFIDNSKLDGFIQFFVAGKCNGRDCNYSCRHCSDYAQKAVRINPEFKKKWQELKEKELESILA